MEPVLKKKSMFNRIFKRQFFVTICTIFLLVFILIGSSYALLNAKTETGLTDVVVQSGNLIATISSDSEIIQMDYTTLGVSDEVGLSYDPYTFTVSNDGENKILYYEIRIVDKEYEISTLPHKSLNYALSVNGSDYTNPQNLGDNKSYIYVGGSLDVGESDTFNLKLWVNEEYGKYANNKVLKASIELTLYSDVPTRNYIIYDSQGGSYISKTNIVSKRISMQTPIKAGYSFTGWSTTPTGNVEYESNAIYNGTNGMTLYAKYEEATITYNLNGGTGEIPSNKASEGITSIVPTKEGYIFKGWSTTANGEVVYQSGDSYNGDSITLYAVWGELPQLYETLETSLVSNLLPSDGDARIVSGDKNLNNYVWFSGKMWRIVALNDDKSIKLVTQNNITTIPFGIDSTYQGSWMFQWLNEDFKDTLYNKELLVNNYEWNATETTTSDKPANTTMVSGMVGLLNYYEYVNSYSNASYSTGYLNNGQYWWLMTPYSSGYVWYVKAGGGNYNRYSYFSYNARPSVNLKSNTKILGGNGTNTSPYIIDGDISTPNENELLNERVSGEYLYFNNEIYRIVSIENGITKITKLGCILNGSSCLEKKISSTVNYGTGTDNNYWDYYLNNDWYSALNENYRRMIVKSDWYLGKVGGKSTSSYKNSLCKTQNTTETTALCERTDSVYNNYVGLGRVGEMFTSQISEFGKEINVWTITPYDTSKVRFVNYGGDASDNYLSYIYEDSARPSFYLKSNVKIGDVDGDGKVGTGLPNDPYEITMD